MVGHGRRSSHDGGMFMGRSGRRRSSSQGDETPRQSILFQSASGHDPAGVGADPHTHSGSRRLGFLSEKLLSTTSADSMSSHAAHRILPSALQVRTHARGDSALGTSNNVGVSLDTSYGTATAGKDAKVHSSPTKLAISRTYDAKLVSREMHRLGNLAHLPTSHSATSPTPSSHNMGPSAAPNNPSTSSNEPWQMLHVHVLPLFNGEPLRVPIEDLNQLVKRHIAAVISQSPSKALHVLENDTSDLIASGMVTLNAKLTDVDDEKLVTRVVEMWGFFWDNVLPYVEGALLPLQTEPVLNSLYSRVLKAHKPSTSPISAPNKGSMSSFMLSSTSQIDVRTVALQSFRDNVILPAFPRMYVRLTAAKDGAVPESPISPQPRLQQMLLVLVSQRTHRPISLSLADPAPQPTPGEAAVQHLLRIVRAPLTTLERGSQRSTGALSFLAGGPPRDRRGRIGQRPGQRASDLSVVTKTMTLDGDDEGGETPRVAGRFMNVGKEREFLESLKSPEQDHIDGGWGLGGGEERKAYEDDDEEGMDWDQAQAVVERMVGMNANGSNGPSGGR